MKGLKRNPPLGMRASGSKTVCTVDLNEGIKTFKSFSSFSLILPICTVDLNEGIKTFVPNHTQLVFDIICTVDLNEGIKTFVNRVDIKYQ